MNKYLYFIIGILVALIYWFFDSSLHHFGYGEPGFEWIPTDINELWMRIVICLLIVLFGFFADFHVRSIVKKERELEAQDIYRSTVYATHHILNNLLNQMQLFKLEALRSEAFDKEVLAYFDTALDDASTLIERLSSIESISEDSIKDSIKPS